MEQIPKIVEQRLHGMTTVGPHPDANLLAAFTEKSLSGHERGKVLEHLAHCPDCREVVSLLLPEPVGSETIFPKPSKAWWLSWPALRWAAVATCLVVVGAAISDRYLQHEKVATFGALKQTDSIAPKNNYSALKIPDSGSEKDRLSARPEAPPAAESTRDFNAGIRARRESAAPTQPPAAMASISPTTKNAPNAVSRYDSARAKAAKVPLMSESVEVSAAPSPSAQGVAGKQAGDQIKRDASADASFSGGAAPRVTNETVEVTAEAAAVETTEAAPGKAKDIKKSPDKELQTQTGSSLVTENSVIADQLSVQGRNYTSLVALTPTRWSISAEGTVERSLDAGKTWQPVQVANRVVFRAISALGPEVWVGGTGGALYHSSDSGQTWTQVQPREGDTPLTTDIISLQFIDALHGKLSTVDHQTWTTSDAGKSWQK